MSKITLTGHIIVPDCDLARVKAGLPEHIRLTRKEEGCLVFDVKQDSVNHSVFRVYEEFTDRKAFDIHQKRVKSSHWGEITQAVERHYTIHKDR